MQMKGGMVGGYEVVINNAVTMHVDEIVTLLQGNTASKRDDDDCENCRLVWYVHRTISIDDLAPLQGLSLHSTVTSSMPRHSRPPQYGPTHDLYLVLTL